MRAKKINLCLIALELCVVLIIAGVIIYFAKSGVRDDLSLSDITKKLLPENPGSSFKASDAMGLRKYYGLDATDYEDFVLYLPASNMDASELLIVVLKDESQSEAVVSACLSRVESQKKVFESYGMDQMALLNSAKIVSDGRYVLFVVSETSVSTAEKFRDLLGSGEDLSTIPRENEGDINNLSTLSTEKLENVDKTEDVASATPSESASETETISKLNSTILTDAEYYYSFYSAAFLLAGKKSEKYSDTAFIMAYESIKNETISDYFYSEGWEIYEGGDSLSLNPTPLLMFSGNSSCLIWTARAVHAFELITQSHIEDPQWDNPDSLKPQFHCHVLYAGSSKTPWNIESFRTETDFLKVCLYKGNP